MPAFVSVLCVLSNAAMVFALPPASQPSRGGRGVGAGGRFERREQHEQVIFKLKNVESGPITSMLLATFPQCSSYAVMRPNTVVFSGPPEAVEAARRLIAEMEEAQKENLEERGTGAVKNEGPQIVIAPVQHRRVEELYEQLHRLYSADGWQLKVSSDRSRSRLLLSGDAGLVKDAQALLKQLDTPATGVQVEFAFLQASETPQGSPIPADLAEVAKELERFGKLSLFGRLSTIAVEGEKFNLEGQIVPGVQAEVSGFVGSGSPDGSIKMEIKASLQLTSASKPVEGAGVLRPYFRVETAVTTQRGEYLVLGSAPTGTALGESAILVMHVRK